MKRLVFLISSGLLWAQQPEPLSLTEAEQTALRNHPQIEASRLEAAAAGQIPNQVRAGQQLIVNGSVTGAGAPDGTRLAAGGLNNPVIYSRLASGITVNQLLWDFGRNRALVASAGERARAATESANANRAQVLLGVRQAYYAALRAQALVQVAQRTVAARSLVAEQVKALTDAQLKSSLDQTFAEVAVSEARLLLSQAQNERRAADAELSLALGYREPRTFTVTEPLEANTPTPELAALLADAMLQRPDLKARRREHAAAESLAIAEKKNRLPSIAAVGSLGYVPFGVSGIGRDVFAASGLNVSLPFLNGGLFKAREAEAQLRASASARRVSELENRISRDVRVALLNLNNARERLTLSAQFVDRARLALELAQSRYDLGLSSIVELSQAQLAVTQAELQLANARFELGTQRAVLEYQIGVTP